MGCSDDKTDIAVINNNFFRANITFSKYNDNETPIEDATIKLENEYGLVFTAKTENSGEATFNIIPGGYRVYVQKNGETYITYFYVNITDDGVVIYIGLIIFIILILMLCYFGVKRRKSKRKN